MKKFGKYPSEKKKKKSEKGKNELVWSLVFRLYLGEWLGSLWLRSRGKILSVPLSVHPLPGLNFPSCLLFEASTSFLPKDGKSY